MIRNSRNLFLLSIVLLAIIFSSGCKMFDYSPYDVHISGEKNINATNIIRIEKSCHDKDTLRIAAMGDSQRFYDETLDFVNHINTRGDIDFVIHGGDFTDFGATDEFIWQRDILQKLKVPYVGLLGNHDCLGSGKEAYEAIWGKANFSFIAGNIKFVCLNTNALEYDYSEAIPDFDFITNEIADRKDDFFRTIVCMHAAPFSDVFNNNVASVFERYINEFPGLMFCFNAHGHSIKVDNLYGDGLIYYQCDCMQSRTYILFTITKGGYTYEVCHY